MTIKQRLTAARPRHSYYDTITMAPPWFRPRRPSSTLVITRSERRFDNLITLTRSGPHAAWDSDDAEFENHCKFPRYVNWFVYQIVTR